jgi:hypothetical protein
VTVRAVSNGSPTLRWEQNGGTFDVFPINYLAHHHELFFRSAPGSKLIDLTLEPNIAFEIDGEHARHV